MRYYAGDIVILLDSGQDREVSQARCGKKNPISGDGSFFVYFTNGNFTTEKNVQLIQRGNLFYDRNK